ncbi:MFS transporter [Chloroflexota bacterium]
MIKRRRFPKIFFGWWTVIGGGLLGTWASGYVYYGFSALFKPISAELGLSRAATSVAASFLRLEGSIGSPFVGWATDKFGPRWVILFGVFTIGSGLMLMYFVNSLWTFYLIWGGVVGAGFNLLSIPLDTSISNWFVKKRGFALSIRWLLTGLSGVVILPLVAWLITVQGWRMTFFIGGLVVWLIGFPVVRLCLRRYRPEYYGLLPDGATTVELSTEQMIDRGIEYAAEVEEIEFTLRQAIKTPGFWLLIIAIASHHLVLPVISIHSIPFLTDFGLNTTQAAGMVSMMVLVGLPLRVAGGYLSDRVKRDQMRWLFAGSYFLQAIGFTLFLTHQTLVMIFVWFIIYGIGNGIAYGFMFSIWGRYFGRKAVGSIRGAGTLLTSPIAIGAPIWAGWVYDTNGSYIPVFTVATILLGVSVFLMMLARPPKPPAEVTDIREFI